MTLTIRAARSSLWSAPIAAAAPADLYAADAVHEFPFRVPGFPPRLSGPGEIRTFYGATWGATDARLTEIRDVAVCADADPQVIVGEWLGTGTIGPEERPFQASGLLMARVRDGEIVEMRDYMDVFGTFRAIGRLDDIVALADRAAATSG